MSFLISFCRIKINKMYMNFYKLKLKKTALKYGNNIRVNGITKVNSNTTLGNNISFNGLSISGDGKVDIGSNIFIAPDCLIITQNHNYLGNKLPFDIDNICKDVNIEDNVWVGQRVIILPGVTIEEGAIIQAGSVVVSNIPKCAIAGGHPAKVFSYRNKEKYEKLKKEKKFLIG
jgi:chloramphenicol O-acetyltransferase type B